MPFIAVARRPRPPTSATPTRARIRTYSAAEAPDSSFRKDVTNLDITVPFILTGAPTPVGAKALVQGVLSGRSPAPHLRTKLSIKLNICKRK